MNGATALPCARTTSPPKAIAITTTGVSHSFLRKRRYCHNSPATVMLRSSELIGHRCRRRPRWYALDPIAARLAVEAQAQWILAPQPHDHRHRRDHQEEDQTHDQRVGHRAEQQAEAEPQAIE